MKDFISLPGGVLVHRDGTVLFPQDADWFEAKAHQLGRHIEITSKKPRFYVEGLETDLTQAQAVYLQKVRTDGPPKLTEAEEEEKRLRSVRIAANRAKTNVRKHLKVMGADSMLTLTTRVAVVDEDAFKKLVREFVRRLRRACPTFCGISITEPQKRGAWHAHIGCPRHALAVHKGRDHKVKSYNVIRAIWRSVTKDLGGNIDVSAHKRNSQRSAAKIAAYLSKYLVKSFEDGAAYSNRWTRFGGEALPPPVDLGRFTNAAAMIADLYYLLDEDHTVASGVWSHFGDWFYLAAEKPA